MQGRCPWWLWRNHGFPCWGLAFSLAFVPLLVELLAFASLLPRRKLSIPFACLMTTLISTLISTSPTSFLPLSWGLQMLGLLPLSTSMSRALARFLMIIPVFLLCWRNIFCILTRLANVSGTDYIHLRTLWKSSCSTCTSRARSSP